MSKVGKWESGKVAPLGQLIHHFPIQSVLHLLNHLFILKADDGSRCCRFRTAEAVHKLLRLELLGQLTETLIITGGTASRHELLVLVSEIVECHLAEEELLALVLDFHCQTAQTAVSVIHRQRLRLLPLVPMAHQDKRQ